MINTQINEHTGEAFSAATVTLLHYDKMNELQNLLFKDFREKLGSTALKNINNLDSRKTLLDILDYLSDEEITQLARKLNLSIPTEVEVNDIQAIFPQEISYIDLVVEIIVDYLVAKEDPVTVIEDSPLYPTQDLLWDPCLIPFENQSFRESLPIPKLNLQFLSFKDYLARNFKLFKYESAFEIRKELEDIIPRMNPVFHPETGQFKGFDGWARMATDIKEFVLYTVQPAKIGKKYPSKVLAEIKYSVANMQSYLKKEWESLKKHDVVFLVSFKKEHGDQQMDVEGEVAKPEKFIEQYGVQYVRGCEIIGHLDEKRKEFNNIDAAKKHGPEGSIRYLQILMDPIQYEKDLNIIGEKDSELYSRFNLVVRRKAKENNFKPILETIKDLFSTEITLPKWLEETILGYGEPEDAHYQTIKERKKKSKSSQGASETVNFFDTFLDEKHYTECFEKNEVIPAAERALAKKPFDLQLDANKQAQNIGNRVILHPTLCTSSSDTRGSNSIQKRNQIRFTQSQVAAINSGLHEGLTIIEGPPGTGKTDVAVQIVNLLFNNFSNEKTLLITHSNHALNDLFEKIAQLNINEKYLLRLGMGEKELSMQQSFSRQGRIDYMLSRRLFFLEEVKILSDSLGLAVYENFTCENSQIFYTHHIRSRWDLYSQKILAAADQIENTKENAAQIGESFPFLKYLSQSRILALNTKDGATSFFEGKDCKFEKEQALFYWEVIEKIFEELRECRAFELLRNNRERGNYIVSRLAKVVAMTSTHAALKRSELLETGFEFQNVIIEEGAQILEIETFIPLLLQKPHEVGQSKLKRIVLIGKYLVLLTYFIFFFFFF